MRFSASLAGAKKVFVIWFLTSLAEVMREDGYQFEDGFSVHETGANVCHGKGFDTFERDIALKFGILGFACYYYQPHMQWGIY